MTTDEGIYKALKDSPLDMHYIDNGPVTLNPLPYGFFPGACGVIENTLFVNGDLSKHPEHKLIRSLAKANGLLIEDVPEQTLCDIGSILHLKGEAQ